MFKHGETLSEKFINRGSWILFFTLLIAPCGYIIRIVLSGGLSVEEFGIMYGVIGLLSLIQIYGDLGLTESLNYFLPKYIVTGDYARGKYLLIFSFLAQIISATFLGALLYMLADFLAVWHFHNPIAKEVIQVMSLFFIGLNLMQISTILFSATQNTKFQKGVDFFRMFLTAIGVSGLFLLGTGSLLSYAWAWIIAIYLTVFLSAFLSYRYYYIPYFQGVQIHADPVLKRSFIKYSLGTFVSANIGTLLHQLDQQILQHMSGSVAGGIYANYLSLVGIPFLVMAPIISFLFPVVSQIGAHGDVTQIRTIHKYFSSVMVVGMTWVGSLFFILGTTMAVFLYGLNYLPSGVALSFIAPFLVLNVLIQINFQILAGVGRVKERIHILAWTLLLNITVMISMLSAYHSGMIPFPSAASVASFSVGISWLLMWYLSYRAVASYRSPLDWYWIIKNLVIAALFSFACLYGHILDHIPDFGTSGKLLLLLQICSVLLMSMTLFLLMNLQKIREFIHMIQQVRTKK